MTRILFALVATLLLGSAPAFAQQSLGVAVAAAMGEAMKDPRYAEILGKYFLPVPDLAGDPKLASARMTPYPAVDAGSLLAQVLKRKQLRIGWIGVGIPWSQPGPDGRPIGLAIDFWVVVLDKLGAHYGTTIAAKYVEYDAQSGNNEMYRWLASDADPDCAALKLPSPENCYDVIGGAYAINSLRKTVSAVTPAYYPLNMSAVRTRAPVNDPTVRLDSAEAILAAAARPELKLVFAALPDTGESTFLRSVAKKTGETFTEMPRDPKSNVLEFAQNTTAHFVLGTNVRLAVTRQETPQFCADCKIIPNLLVFDGVGFATYLPPAK